MVSERCVAKFMVLRRFTRPLTAEDRIADLPLWTLPGVGSDGDRQGGWPVSLISPCAARLVISGAALRQGHPGEVRRHSGDSQERPTAVGERWITGRRAKTIGAYGTPSWISEASGGAGSRLQVLCGKMNWPV